MLADSLSEIRGRKKQPEQQNKTKTEKLKLLILHIITTKSKMTPAQIKRHRFTTVSMHQLNPEL